MNLKELAEATKALDELSRVSGLTVRTSLEAVKLLDALEVERRFFADKLDELCRKYGKQDESGVWNVEPYQLDEKTREAFAHEYEELCTLKVDAPEKKLKIPGTSVGLTPKSLQALRDFVEIT